MSAPWSGYTQATRHSVLQKKLIAYALSPSCPEVGAVSCGQHPRNWFIHFADLPDSRLRSGHLPHGLGHRTAAATASCGVGHRRRHSFTPACDSKHPRLSLCRSAVRPGNKRQLWRAQQEEFGIGRARGSARAGERNEFSLFLDR